MRFTILLILFSINIYAQSTNINRIELIHKHSKQNFSTKIFIDCPQNEKKSITLKACIGEKCKDTIINRETFDTIYLSLIKISPKNMIADFEIGKDGATTTIKFGKNSNEISYSKWDLDKADKTLDLDFLKSVQLILKVANLKIDNLN